MSRGSRVDHTIWNIIFWKCNHNFLKTLWSQSRALPLTPKIEFGSVQNNGLFGYWAPFALENMVLTWITVTESRVHWSVSNQGWFSHQWRYRRVHLQQGLTFNRSLIRSTSLPHKPPFGKAMCSCNFRLFTQVDTCVWGKICHRAANGVIIWRWSNLLSLSFHILVGLRNCCLEEKSLLCNFYMTVKHNKYLTGLIQQLPSFSSRGTREQAVMWWLAIVRIASHLENRVLKESFENSIA